MKRHPTRARATFATAILLLALGLGIITGLIPAALAGLATFISGDVNDDGVFDVLDSTVIRRELAGLGPGITQMCVPPPPLPGLCFPDDVLVGFDANGTPICRGPALITTLDPDFRDPDLADFQAVQQIFSSVAIVDGAPVIAYYAAREDAEISQRGDLQIIRCGNSTCSTGNTVTLIETLGGVSQTPIRKGSDGLPVVAYRSPATGQLKLLHCGNASCTTGNSIAEVETSVNAGAGWVALAIGVDGLPVLAYAFGISSNQLFKVTHCGNLACSSGNTTTEFASLGTFGGTLLKMAIGSDGFPLIIHPWENSRSLGVLHCGNIECSENNTLGTLALPVLGISGSRGIDIEIDADGLPLLVYEAAASGGPSIAVASCVDVSCSSASLVAELGEGNTSLWPSIAIGVDGFPIVSFNDFTTGTLRVVHCQDATCAGPKRHITIDPDAGSFLRTDAAIGADGMPVILYSSGPPATIGPTELKLAHCDDFNCAGF